MEERLKQLQAKIEADVNFVEKLLAQENPEDAQVFLKEEGLEFSLEELEQIRVGIVNAMEKGTADELSDEDLEDVAGGTTAGQGVDAAIGAVGNAANTAVNAVNNAANTAVNTVGSGVSTAVRWISRW